jgi:serine/threonine-protein phosphatase 6 regulatory ankyrin repeat subunit B
MDDQDGEDLAAALAELGEQLFNASQDGEAAEAARLLDLNAPINHRVGEEQWTPLTAAARRGHIEVVTLLANRGSDLEARNTNGYNALMAASAKGHLAVVQLLVEKKSDIEARTNKGSHALMWASAHGHLAVVQYLATKGSSINTTDNEGFDACLYAAVDGFADIVLFLISKGGDPRVKNQLNHSAFTHFGIEAAPAPAPKSSSEFRSSSSRAGRQAAT